MRRKNSHDTAGQGGVAAQAARRGDKGQAGGRQAERGETGDETDAVSPLPVFLFPSELLFHAAETSAHRRVLTLYNPYSFSLSFKMYCTAPSLFRVVESAGSVRAQSCVDLVVRHLDVSPRHWGRRDRFRLEVRGGGQVGRREIWAELRGGEEGGGGGEERRGGGQQRALSPHTSPHTSPLSPHTSPLSPHMSPHTSPLSPLLVPTRPHLQLPTCTAMRSVSQWVVCVSVAALCVAVLMLPLHTESSPVVPLCLHVSTNQKLVCAYILGLLTMVFLR